MIETKNAIYLHVPKTGGSWRNQILKPIEVEYKEHGWLKSRPDKPVFAFVRNPWDWHRSMYKFETNGSESHLAQTGMSAILKGLPKNYDFDDYVTALCAPTSAFKTLALSIAKINVKINNLPTDYYEPVFFEKWLTSTKGHYQFIYDIAVEFATEVGRYENMKEDFINMLKSAGDLTDKIHDTIETTAPMNISKSTADRSLVYSQTTADLIYKSCKEIIDNHGYTF